MPPWKRENEESHSLTQLRNSFHAPFSNFTTVQLLLPRLSSRHLNTSTPHSPISRPYNSCFLASAPGTWILPRPILQFHDRTTPASSPQLHALEYFHAPFSNFTTAQILLPRLQALEYLHAPFFNFTTALQICSIHQISKLKQIEGLFCSLWPGG